MTARTPDLLDLLDLARFDMPTVPDGLTVGWRNTNPDLRSRGGFRWAWPGQWSDAPDDGRDLTTDHPSAACPSETLGGLCLARTWNGARSGGVTSAVCLLVAYDPADMLGQDEHKIRVRRALTLDVIDLAAIVRRANLWGADLRGADLRGADLRGAGLEGANLWGADLRGADLEGANLVGANLRDANLRDADLRDADLEGANLRDADLRDANLRDADLEGADLWDANLRDANLLDADLEGANLEGADLEGADLRDANLEGANLEGASANGLTRLPVGWVVTDLRIVRSES